MAIHPAPPTDLEALTDAYAHTVQAIIDLAQALRPGDAELPTDCPGWTIWDQVAHVVGTESAVAGESIPEVDVSQYAHVRNDFGAYVERLIEVRRGRSMDELVEELQGRLSERLAAYRAPGLTVDSEVNGLFGPTPLGEMIGLRLFDIWCHEQDIREALDRPGNLDSGGAANAVARLFRGVPKIVARTAAIEPGNAVILDVTGPVVARTGVRVIEQDGKVLGQALFSGDTQDEAGADDLPETTSITLSTQALTRRGAGRRTTEDTRYTVTGDEDIARRVLDSFAQTP